MAPDPNEFDRCSVRLLGYDYARPGAYFVTLCCVGRRCLLGSISDGTMSPSAFGAIVQEEWARTATVRRELTMDAFVVMPNHVHGVVWIGKPWYVDEPQKGDPPVAPTAPSDPECVHRASPDTGGAAPPGTIWTSFEPNDAIGPARRSLASFVAGFKATATARINTMRKSPGAPVWQRGFYEHIVRSGKQLLAIRAYIAQNPSRWAWDRENPDAEPEDP